MELRPAPSRDVQLSIVIPAYNEQGRTASDGARDHPLQCTTRNVDFELIIADDGSRDGTLALGHGFFRRWRFRIRCSRLPTHGQRCHRPRVGMLNSKGRFVLPSLDADGAAPLNEIRSS